MSNFQRTRSKVWWGDSPPDIGSPVAQQPEWNRNSRVRDEPDWEPQLPHWIANQPDQQRNNSVDNIAQPNNEQINQWPLRHGSPGSHKSQDSGFSDSDTSPPPSQPYVPPDNNDTNKSSSSSDSNNNENITVKQVDLQNTLVDNDAAVDTCKMSDNVSCGVPTPRPRLRSSSVIQTPYDLQKYYEIHNDEEHMELLKDTTENEMSKPEPKYPAPTNINKEKSMIDKTYKSIPPKVISPKPNSKVSTVGENKVISSNKLGDKENSPKRSAIDKNAKELSYKNLNALSPSKKYPEKKSFVSSTETDNTKLSKVAKVKDLETSKNKCEESLEYIKLADNNEIVVNNQPRIRSPISNISYVSTERISARKPDFNRSISNEYNLPICSTPKFQRNRLNKSLNFEGQRLDQQILDIQEGYHSLGYIDEDEQTDNTTTLNQDLLHKPSKALLGKNIMDSLQLKPPKKPGPKYKHRLATRTGKAKDLFRIFPLKKEKPTAVETYAGGVLNGSRVPALGLPRTSDQNSWVIVGHPEKEMLIPSYNERLVATDSDINLQAKAQNADDLAKRLTPPPQFRDMQKTPYETDSKNDKNLTYDSKREKLKTDEVYFTDVQMNLACTSTPKMLAPHEYMNGVRTPKSLDMSKEFSRRINLLEDLNSGIVFNNRNEILYREKSIDQSTLERLCDKKPEPVQHWLCDLIGSCDNECMTTLQSKPIGAEMKAMVSASSVTISGNIKKVQTHGQIIVHQYSDVLRQIEANKVGEDQICLLIANINEFVLAHSITLNTKPPGETPERWDKIKKSLQMYLQKLIDTGEDVKLELNESNVEWIVITKHLNTLIEIFLETTKAVLVQQMKTLVSIIEEPPSDMILKSTLTSIGHLAMLSDQPESSLHEKCAEIIQSITDLPFVECGVPRALLIAIIESSKSSIKALSLRALATVCVTGDAVKQFEEGGGIEILSDILSDRSNPEPQMREAITVLTQITAPWLRGHYDLTQLHLYLNKIVDNITGILSQTECCQLLLLCTACLVNLVRELELEKREGDRNNESDIVEVFIQHKTVERLLEAVKKRGPNISVFLQEQTASLLASLSRVSRAVLPLSRVSASSAALVCFTRAPPALAPRDAELRARARLHCHAAEAISRLVIIKDVAQQIVQLEGVPHLIKLVKTQRARSTVAVDVNPDQILIHCLKALRTIYRHLPDAFTDYPKEVEDMIRPHLMESLMLYSVKQESYV